MRRSWGASLLMALLCGMAAAQTTTPAAKNAPQEYAAAAPPAPSDQPKALTQPAANLSPQQQRLLDQADQLLALAQKLQMEVSKTNQYTLSLNTLRRAGDIEKLAKELQKQIARENH